VRIGNKHKKARGNKTKGKHKEENKEHKRKLLSNKSIVRKLK